VRNKYKLITTKILCIIYTSTFFQYIKYVAYGFGDETSGKDDDDDYNNNNNNN